MSSTGSALVSNDVDVCQCYWCNDSLFWIDIVSDLILQQMDIWSIYLYYIGPGEQISVIV